MAPAPHKGSTADRMILRELRQARHRREHHPDGHAGAQPPERRVAHICGGPEELLERGPVGGDLLGVLRAQARLEGLEEAPVHAETGGDPVQICAQALEIAKLQDADTLIFDTAGRLHIDEALMFQLENIVQKTKPHEILFVCDAMIGQSVVAGNGTVTMHQDHHMTLNMLIAEVMGGKLKLKKYMGPITSPSQCAGRKMVGSK